MPRSGRRPIHSPDDDEGGAAGGAHPPRDAPEQAEDHVPVTVHRRNTFPATGRNVVFSLDEGGVITGKLQLRLSWDPVGSPPDIVVHLSAFLLGEDSKVAGGHPYFCVNHDNDRSKDGSTARLGRRRHGRNVRDESITVDLDVVTPDVNKVVFVAYIQDAKPLQHSFGIIKGGLVSIYQFPADGTPDDERATELDPHLLDDDYYETETAVIVGELFRRASGKWGYRDIGEGRPDMVEVGADYGVTFITGE